MLDEMRAFVALVEAGSIYKAADRIHLSQPAVSRRIQGLEQSLGATLFDRSAKPLRLTASGHAAYERCRGILQAVDDLRAAMADGAPRGDFRIGLSPGLADPAISRPIAVLGEAFPAVRLTVVSGFSGEMLARVEAGTLDAAVVVMPPEAAVPRGLHARDIGREEIVVVAGRQHGLGGRPVKLAELATFHWVLNPEGCGYRRALAERLARCGAALHGGVDVWGLAVQLRLVADGAGLALVSRRALAASGLAEQLDVVAVTDFDFAAVARIAWRDGLGGLGRVLELFARELETALAGEP